MNIRTVGPVSALLSVLVLGSATALADSRHLYNSNVDFEGRTLYEHEFEHVRDGVPGRRLGHAIQRHFNKSYAYLRGRCTTGTSGGQRYRQTTYGSQSYYMNYFTRLVVFKHRSAIFNYSRGSISRSRGFHRNIIVGDSGDSYGIKVVGCTRAGSGIVLPARSSIQYATTYINYGPSWYVTHERAQKKWYLNTSYPQ